MINKETIQAGSIGQTQRQASMLRPALMTLFSFDGFFIAGYYS
jgi:hypothetical protein